MCSNRCPSTLDPEVVIRGIRQIALHRIRDFFVGSRDFNGIPLDALARELLQRHGLPAGQFRAHIRALVRNGKISLHFASHSQNPHIKRIPDLPIEEQLRRLDGYLKDGDNDRVCAYPSADVIQMVLEVTEYAGRPFTKRLALGEAQLTPIFFDLDVLDKYFRDPRYRFEFHDFSGSISISNEHYAAADMPGRDKVLLDTFGIGYDADRNRVVVAYLRYLADLSPEHQQIWNAHVVDGPCQMNSDYELATIWGEWPRHVSAYQALLIEQSEINKLCDLIGKPPLFRETFDENRPREFAPTLRPTLLSLQGFIRVLDKMLSENINRDFFRGDIPLERDHQRPDGKVEVQRPGTLKLLQEWITTWYRPAGPEADVERDVIEPLRRVRQLRQRPAHALDQDAYNRDYVRQQDELVGSVLRALIALRLILWSHPRARNKYSPPAWLDGHPIVLY